ncbi:hypothetical protein LIZ64_08860 [[Clostridium] hylemonae]|uniref:hypothetical protein n=1 Tax=[Clostridium] hylemonae TaxID=89153 RepID=UPI001D09584F|nr:hypothetical protein [[Clostridium] hylemonae]MCB7521847.1 hypothetical protein [[Clostridium] hylemonae]
MEYKSIETQEDIEIFMAGFNGFHDSCIKELYYYSGGYVSVDRAMYPFNSVRSVSIIFQSQISEHPAIEMRFELIHQLNLQPRREDYDCIIYDASLVKIGELFYWSEWGEFQLEDIGIKKGTWLSAEEIKWRALENSLGESKVYSNVLDEEPDSG